ncbi:MAG TPA: hypothetical protein VF092_09045 [Longimicrobium sp.]
MRTDETADIPVACVPSAIPADERAEHAVLARRLFAEASLETRPLPDGWALRFAPEELEQVARFVSLERLCCPFVTFTIEVAPGSGLWLRMTGPEGTREVFEAAMPEFAANG